MAEALSVFLRWLHLSSAALLLGGLVYARLALAASSKTLSPESGEAWAAKAAALFRPLAFAAMFGLLVSGAYHYLLNPGHSAKYLVVLGIKLLLVAHIFSGTVLALRPAHPRRARILFSVAVTGLLVIGISAYLRRIF